GGPRARRAKRSAARPGGRRRSCPPAPGGSAAAWPAEPRSQAPSRRAV
ncbi:MAG: hypothetical protein AVDCRST_MAG77-776, partial [uncultured Chloroflexi bacterium]